MKSVLILLFLFGCSEVETQNEYEVMFESNYKERQKETYINKEQNRYCIDSNYQISIFPNYDNYKDGVFYSRIDIPKTNLIPIDYKLDSLLLDVIDAEIEKQKGIVKTLYSSFPPVLTEPEITKTNSLFYKSGSVIIGNIETKLDYKYLDIVTIIIIDSDEVYVYSTSDVLGLNVSVEYFQKEGNKYTLYGDYQGTPEFNCGGAYELRMETGKRRIVYESCEVNH